MEKERKIIESLLKEAGITINGNKACDIQVHNKNFYNRVFRHGSLGLGESYMDGWWDCEKLDQFFHKVLGADLERRVKGNWVIALKLFWNSFLNTGKKSRAFEIAKRHYDIGNDFYMAFLDPYNQYTCGYFKDTTDLNTAQEQKLELICKKLQLKKSDRVLDMGCGWGGFAKYASLHYGCQVTGINISDEQIKYAKEFTKGLPIEMLKMDYRDLTGQYDKILICGMTEHVGYKNYRTLMKIVHNTLKDGGLFLLHTIGGNRSLKAVDPWIEKYIFPNSMVPSIKQIGKSIEGLFVVEDWHNFGTDYDKTLMEWYKNFENNWGKIKSNYDDRFYRMWKYYLLSCAGSFRARKIQLWQIVLSKKGIPGGYKSIR